MMHDNETLAALSSRTSFPRLQEPAPQGEQLRSILKTALRAPDHMMLRPARYMMVAGSQLERLGAVFEQAGRKEEACSEVQAEKYRNMPLRAPFMLIAVSKNLEHPKVPVFEQEQSVAAGLAYILVALQAEGFGGIWRTGSMAQSPYVKAKLGVESHESIVGFLYIGTPVGEPKPLPRVDFDDYFSNLNLS